MDNNYILESMASDLKRVALGLHRGSNQMAERFLDEALKRKDEVELQSVAPYIKKLLDKLNKDIDSETALMYSTLLQNYTQRNSSLEFTH